MKGIFFLAIILTSISASSQSIKDLLYSGKLKSDSGTTVRKGDDLSTKIDTSTRRPVVVEKVKVGAIVNDTTAVSGVLVAKDSVAAPIVSATKSNDKIWKDYIDELTGTLQTDVMTSKKIKSGTYSVLIEYEIGLDGSITVSNVSCSPESSFLEQQVKERITLGAPQMTPLLNAYGKPRKAIKKYTLVLAKG